MQVEPEPDQVGLVIVGLAGAVGTTVLAGLELLRVRAVGSDGLFLAECPELTDYASIVVGGWDVYDWPLKDAAAAHGVLSPEQLSLVGHALSTVSPWTPAQGGASARSGEPLHKQVERIASDINQFREQHGLDRVVMVNLGPTEPVPHPGWATAEELLAALQADDPAVPASVVYALAAVEAGAGYANFTPSLGAGAPGLAELGAERGVPIAGRDGKTGQTMLKTVLAPALRSRALNVQGWYSLNLLGNGDGVTLRDPDNCNGKILTKEGVLDSLLGQQVEDHTVRIDYYRPRGDAKEAWDNIDVTGFLGAPMQIKVNFLARDSILAAPLVLELTRCLELAMRRGESGVIEELGFFFKLPMTRTPGRTPEHGLFEQEKTLRRWLAG